MFKELKIKVILRSSKEIVFTEIQLEKKYIKEDQGVKINVGSSFPATVKITPPSVEDPIASIEYDLVTHIKDYHKVIIPDGGREYSSRTQLVNFWSSSYSSCVNNIRMPLYVFTGQDMFMSMAFGIIGENFETDFITLEPRTNRALIAYMRRLSIRIKRGTTLYPIPKKVTAKNPDGSIEEHIYYRAGEKNPKEPWLLTLRDFSAYQRKLYNLKDFTTTESMYPLWCSWTDWHSNDVTDKVIMENVREGIKLGIKNYIIDDGWFGPGLDNERGTPLNVGDWEPDPVKIKDMKRLVEDIKKEGANPMVWCAPHAVAPGANCFEKRKKYLIKKQNNELLMTGNEFHVLCFMCHESREIMADICAGFIAKWGFKGAKYDLFNCVPNDKCYNSEHNHDVDTMIEGLEKTMELIDKKCRALNKNYIIELKQNYATPFLSRYGTVTRAGDTPYSTEGNFLRTLYIQGYTPYAINDYQTITNYDTPQSAAAVIIKMIAVGIPTYSIDFTRLNDSNKKVLAHFNNWYIRNVKSFMKFRIPLDAENNAFKIEEKERDIYILVNEGIGHIEIRKSCVILNASFKDIIFLKPFKKCKSVKVLKFDCFGKKKGQEKLEKGEWNPVKPDSAGIIQVDIL